MTAVSWFIIKSGAPELPCATLQSCSNKTGFAGCADKRALSIYRHDKSPATRIAADHDLRANSLGVVSMSRERAYCGR